MDFLLVCLFRSELQNEYSAHLSISSGDSVSLYLVSFFYIINEYINKRIPFTIKMVNRDSIHCDGFKSGCIHLIHDDAHIGGDE